MAVTKYKRVGGQVQKLQRFISNLVPANSYKRHLPGDDIHLPYLGQLAMLNLDQDKELLIDSEDLTSCYNLFSLPREWAGFMAFGKPGGEALGQEGVFRLAADKQTQLIGLSLALLVAPQVTEFELRNWAGKAIFGMSFRRPLMAILQSVFHDIVRAQSGPIQLSSATPDEVVSVVALTPMMAMNLRTALDDEVTITDA
eukprot:s993_g15.t1